MRKTILLMIALFGLAVIPSIASAMTATPGMSIPLVIKNYEITTDTFILPDWKPSMIRWSLISPSGHVAYMVDSSIDTVSQVGGGTPIIGSTTWSISEDSGTIKIPAFAEQGEWIVNAKFYDRQLLIFYNSQGANLYAIDVGAGGVVDNINAPLTYAFNIPIIDQSYTIALDLIYIIAMIIIIPLVLLILISLRRNRRK
jgi:hypothetical protein